MPGNKWTKREVLQLEADIVWSYGEITWLFSVASMKLLEKQSMCFLKPFSSDPRLTICSCGWIDGTMIYIYLIW